MGRTSYLLPILGLAGVVHGVNNGLAVTPQMAWNDWNAFGCGLSQELILNTAATMLKTGLRDVGFHYINLDDCWSAGRLSNGSLIANSTKFPNGMFYLGQQLHSQGFGFGIYSDAGNETCAGYAGSLGYETVDAERWASWGVDYLKYDNCNNNGESGSQAISSARYEAMGKALNSTGRKILYSICNWGQDSPWVWGPSVGNSWRISGDIYDNFNSDLSTCDLLPGSPQYGGYQCSVERILGKAATIANDGSKGGWNDLDMLEVGNGGMTDAEYVTHFSMWSLVKSPLIIGTDVTKMSPQTYSIFANAPVIAISQDPLGMPANLRWNQSNSQLWSGPVVSTTTAHVNDMVVALINTGAANATLTATMSDIFAKSSIPAAQWQVYDLWGSRLTNSQASTILSNGAASSSSLLYNATKTPYATGLSQGNTQLFGTSYGTVSSSGSIQANVAANACRIFRLRASSS